MAIEDAIVALTRDWLEVARHLNPDQRQRLQVLTEELDGSARNRAMAGIADLLAGALPGDHPVIEALFAGDLSQSATLDWPAITEGLRQQVDSAMAPVPMTAAQVADPSASPAEPRPGEEILRKVADRVLQAAAWSADEVRQRGGDPDDPGLIRLRRPDGRPQWPAFQFSPDGSARSVIRTVNNLLDASADPVAAADWWLSRNLWLGDLPSALIGRVPDDHLIGAARAVGSED
jgi:hypothetical protein